MICSTKAQEFLGGRRSDVNVVLDAMILQDSNLYPQLFCPTYALSLSRILLLKPHSLREPRYHPPTLPPSSTPSHTHNAKHDAHAPSSNAPPSPPAHYPPPPPRTSSPDTPASATPNAPSAHAPPASPPRRPSSPHRSSNILGHPSAKNAAF
ncbi:hypothetical protein CVT26_007326, partial [Gymnopilus dilepis]